MGGGLDTGTGTGKCHVKTKAEVRLKQLQAKES